MVAHYTNGKKTVNNTVGSHTLKAHITLTRFQTQLAITYVDISTCYPVHKSLNPWMRSQYLDKTTGNTSR